MIGKGDLHPMFPLSTYLMFSEQHFWIFLAQVRTLSRLIYSTLKISHQLVNIGHEYHAKNDNGCNNLKKLHFLGSRILFQIYGMTLFT